MPASSLGTPWVASSRNNPNGRTLVSRRRVRIRRRFFKFATTARRKRMSVQKKKRAEPTTDTPGSLCARRVFALLLIKLSLFHNDDVSLNDKFELLPFVFINPICVRDPCV